MLLLRRHLQEEQIVSSFCAPSVLQIAVSVLSSPRMFACLLSWSSAVPSGLYPSHLLIFKTLGFRDMVLAEACIGLLGEGPAVLGLRQA